MSRVTIQVIDHATPTLRHYTVRLDGIARVEANRAMGEAVQCSIVAHLRARAGGDGSGSAAQAADAASGADVVQADARGATLRLRHPLIARAFRGLRTTAQTAGAATIPLHARARHLRAASFPNLSHRAGSGALATSGGESVSLASLALVRFVTQPQDRSWMPGDEELEAAARQGLEDFLRQSQPTAAPGRESSASA